MTPQSEVLLQNTIKLFASSMFISRVKAGPKALMSSLSFSIMEFAFVVVGMTVVEVLLVVVVLGVVLLVVVVGVFVVDSGAFVVVLFEVLGTGVVVVVLVLVVVLGFSVVVVVLVVVVDSSVGRASVWPTVVSSSALTTVMISGVEDDGDTFCTTRRTTGLATSDSVCLRS